MGTPSISSLAQILRLWFPILKRMVSSEFHMWCLSGHLAYLWHQRTERGATIDYASEMFHRIGTQLVKDRKAAILKEASEKHLQGIGRKDLQGHDLLTQLIRANMAQDVPKGRRLSDEDVIGQIPTFLLAGHETTGMSSTWALYSLSRYPKVQQKLREELVSVPSDTPTMEELSALPYLDALVTETLRLHPRVAMLPRVASKDDVIPLSKPFTDRQGKVHSEIRIAKGNKIIVPIMAMHRSREIWGEDAMEFKPERWQQPPEAISAIPGVWGHLLTFIGGPRAWIGYRFAIIELKAILFTLVRAFEFELAVPVDDIISKTPFGRPSLLSEPEKGYQLPLNLKPYKAV
ncbi:Cytochrome P450 3A12 [Trametes pubescens]|uniref:Cytochrome P450 3A12 n=1 Tax=Trametes pubescens TaxID=154538 RepID=A0A1M2V4F8_TRAPU|nr:Cytochrome P450 3A12 [Trametes pubescens]